MEDYKMRYEEALERARKLYNEAKVNEYTSDMEDYEAIFPELKESEDELSWLKKYLEEEAYILSIDIRDDEDRMKLKKLQESLAWLEKQGEQKYTQKDIDDAYLKGIADVKREVEKIDEQTEKMKKEIAEFIFNSKEDIKQRYEWIKCLGFDVKFSNEEKQAEQKPTDKVEPKFKVDDWVVFNGLVLHIDEIVDGYYRTTTIGGIPNSYDWNIDNAARLWSIEDAKDGDVLYSIDSKQPFIYKERPQFSQAIGYCCINKFGEFTIWNTSKCVICTDKYIPATKEQRDLLFQKIHEAGYEWDAEKKELRKIEKQKPVEWTKEDNEMLYVLLKGISCYTYFSGIPSEDIVNWLKSLKQRFKEK